MRMRTECTVTRSPATTPPAGAQAPVPHSEAPPPGSKLGAHYRECFGCGDDHPTGLHLQVTVREGVSATAEFTVSEHHQGAPGLAHGGVLTAALDEALGAVGWLLREPLVTGRLETDFLRPVPVGTTLHIAARCTGRAGRKVYTEAEGCLGGPDGQPAIRAAALFVAVPLEHFSEHGRSDAVQLIQERRFEVNP